MRYGEADEPTVLKLSFRLASVVNGRQAHQSLPTQKQGGH